MWGDLTTVGGGGQGRAWPVSHQDSPLLFTAVQEREVAAGAYINLNRLYRASF